MLTVSLRWRAQWALALTALDPRRWGLTIWLLTLPGVVQAYRAMRRLSVVVRSAPWRARWACARAVKVLATGQAQGTFEYVILIVAVALLISGLIFKFGHGIGNAFGKSTTCLTSATGAGFSGNSTFTQC